MQKKPKLKQPTKQKPQQQTAYTQTNKPANKQNKTERRKGPIDIWGAGGEPQAGEF